MLIAFFDFISFSVYVIFYRSFYNKVTKKMKNEVRYPIQGRSLGLRVLAKQLIRVTD